MPAVNSWLYYKINPRYKLLKANLSYTFIDKICSCELLKDHEYLIGAKTRMSSVDEYDVGVRVGGKV